MSIPFILPARDRKAAALFALNLIEHMREAGKIGPQAFPAYRRKHAQLSVGRCIIIIETSGDDTTVTVYLPSDLRMQHGAKVDLSAVISHPGITPPTLLGRAAA